MRQCYRQTYVNGAGALRIIGPTRTSGDVRFRAAFRAALRIYEYTP